MMNRGWHKSGEIAWKSVKIMKVFADIGECYFGDNLIIFVRALERLGIIWKIRNWIAYQVIIFKLKRAIYRNFSLLSFPILVVHLTNKSRNMRITLKMGIIKAYLSTAKAIEMNNIYEELYICNLWGLELMKSIILFTKHLMDWLQFLPVRDKLN